MGAHFEDMVQKQLNIERFDIKHRYKEDKSRLFILEAF